MKIVNIELQNIKSFCKSQKASFKKQINFIIGPNSSGKSNLLEILQACINDIFLESAIYFSDDNKNSKLFRIEKRHINQSNLEERVFVPHFFANDLPLEVIIEIEIEKGDLENFYSLKSIVENLKDFEKSTTNSNLFADAIGQFDISLDYSKIVGKSAKLRFRGIHLEIISEEEEILSFVRYLRYSRFFFHFINFYNISRKDKKNTNYSQSFHYFPPDREVIDTTHQHIVNLDNSESRSINHTYQSEISQTTRFSSSSMLVNRLVESYFLQNDDWKNFKSLLIRHLNIDFSIEPTGNIFQNKFSINFFRSKVHRQIPLRLSSGERELFNFIASTFLHDVKSGIILIDEPEVHLHPKWQKKLQDLLQDLSKTSANQIISVTHSDQFVRDKSLSTLIRVQKNDEESSIFVPDLLMLNEQKNKDIFLFLQSSNNTKVFFADRVILVEGIVDRIIFQALVDLFQKNSEDSKAIEVIEVGGKSNFEKFSKFLNTWKIPHYVISDRDYISDVGPSDLTKLFKTNHKKIQRNLKAEGSTDGEGLVKIVEAIDAKENVSKADLKVLFKFCNYLKSRHKFISEEDVSHHERAIELFISEMAKNGVFILRKGDIEDYFAVSKLSIDTAIRVVEQLELKNIDLELRNIILEIVS